MRHICNNCKHYQKHPEGHLCNKHLEFVDTRDYCGDFDDDELFSPTKVVVFTGVIVAALYFLLKIL